jgi:hypothetical protein
MKSSTGSTSVLPGTDVCARPGLPSPSPPSTDVRRGPVDELASARSLLHSRRAPGATFPGAGLRQKLQAPLQVYPHPRMTCSERMQPSRAQCCPELVP